MRIENLKKSLPAIQKWESLIVQLLTVNVSNNIANIIYTIANLLIKKPFLMYKKSLRPATVSKNALLLFIKKIPREFFFSVKMDFHVILGI